METAALVFQTDFGQGDGAVPAMYGVATSIDPSLRIFDLTHDIPQYNVWEASYRLIQTVQFWPAGTVFVSVVDPGVGPDRKSLAVKTKTGHIIITPDNGTITHVQRWLGISDVRLINEMKTRLPHSEKSHTFHGRDVYAYIGAKIASGQLSFEQTGSFYPVDSLVLLPVTEALRDKDTIHGQIDVLDVRFGSLWTNIPLDLFTGLGIPYGQRVEVEIRNDTRAVYQNFLVYARSFADANVGESLVYVNSLHNMAVAINLGSFAHAYNIGTGSTWKIQFRKAPKLVYE